jgi:hypothetical protein
MNGLRVTRDGVIATAALALLAYEIVLGGARPAVLTVLSSLLLSPVVLRADEARRRRRDPFDEEDDL